MPIDSDKDRRLDEQPPPLFKSWTGVYALVLGFLGFLIVLFHLFTRRYQ